jgi:hypothetical protein
MSERDVKNPEINNNYPKAMTVWQYSIDHPVSRNELDFIAEGTGVKIYTTRPEAFTLGHGSSIYLGSNEASEKIDPFPRAGIKVTRRSTDKYEVLEGVDISLELIAKPSDEYSVFLELWEAEREHIEAVVYLLGGERVL